MPFLASLHPQIVHFVIALLIVGVLLRLVSLTGRLGFAGAAATTLILLGTLASLAAVVSGDEAHGPVERVPGARAAVVEHEEWGVRARNIFVVVSVLELAALGLAALKHRFARGTTIASAIVGIVGLGVLYEAAEHGGELVYGYAGGVGIRSGAQEDVNRLVIAGVFHQANQDRQAGRPEASSALVEAAARRFPDHLELQLFAVEWQSDVSKDAAGAIQRLEALPLAQAEPRLRVRAGLLRANALMAQGNVEGARAVLQTLRNENPNNPQIRQRLEEISR